MENDEIGNYITLLAVSVLFLIFCFCVLILVMALTGNSLGIRRTYMKILLKIFEYGRNKIRKAEKAKRKERICSVSYGQDSDDDTLDVILRESKLSIEGTNIPKSRSFETLRDEFNLLDPAEFCKLGVEAIIDDEVTKCFDTEELRSWNLLTRTNANYQYISLRLSMIWIIGFFFRYFFLLPLRLMLAVIGTCWMLIATAFIGLFQEGPRKRWLNEKASLTAYRILSRSFSATITYHDEQYKALPGGICVANHTSPFDVVILSCNNSYAMVGQNHNGFFGLFQKAMSRASNSHIWFDRSKAKDRNYVLERLKENIGDPTKMPTLIFPEGTCINNTSVMMFKKGSFEAATTVFPAAIKYDPRFGDPFWNSSKQGMIEYIIMMMTSWAIVCDVWFLPPMHREEQESAADFANRVKGAIARKGGLVDLVWDGQLKRIKVKDSWKADQQLLYSQRLKTDSQRIKTD